MYACKSCTITERFPTARLTPWAHHEPRCFHPVHPAVVLAEKEEHTLDCKYLHHILTTPWPFNHSPCERLVQQCNQHIIWYVQSKREKKEPSELKEHRVEMGRIWWNDVEGLGFSLLHSLFTFSCPALIFTLELVHHRLQSSRHLERLFVSLHWTKDITQTCTILCTLYTDLYSGAQKNHLVRFSCSNWFGSKLPCACRRAFKRSTSRL